MGVFEDAIKFMAAVMIFTTVAAGVVAAYAEIQTVIIMAVLLVVLYLIVRGIVAFVVSLATTCPSHNHKNPKSSGTCSQCNRPL